MTDSAHLKGGHDVAAERNAPAGADRARIEQLAAVEVTQDYEPKLERPLVSRL
jgi:hypothetical protein